MSSFYNPRFEVRIEGLTLSADVTQQVLSCSYENNLDIADMFNLVLLNPQNQFSDSPLFDLGKTVEIHMGYGNDLRPMMLGEIAAVAPSFSQSGPPTVTVTGYDKSYKLRHNQPDRGPYQYVSDSVIAAQIAVEAGLIPMVDPSPIFHTKPLHQMVSDFAFLKELAKKTFFEVFVQWDKLYFRFPRPQLEAYVLEWGRNLNSFSPRLSVAGMAGLQVIRSYNEDLAQTIVAMVPVAALSLDDVIEKLGSSVIELLSSLGQRVLRKEPVKSPVDAAAIAKALLQDLLDGLYEGSGACVGIPDLRADQIVLIQGIGKKFSGRYRLKKVTHRIDDGGYSTQFEVTQRSGASLLPLLRKRINEDPPPDAAQPVQGVVIGRVSDNNDLEGKGRVRVRFPWYSDSAQSDWARCMTFMAGDQIGAHFVPDVGDDVMVAFERGDVQRPVVLGSVYNGVTRRSAQLAVDPTRQNKVRQIKTASGHTIRFDDSSGREQLVITDKAGSKITMSQNGTVSIEALNIELTAKQNVSIKAANVRVSLTDPAGTMDVS